MIKKALSVLVATCLLLTLNSVCIGKNTSSNQELSARERVKRLVSYERQDQFKKGVVGTLFGTISLGIGIPLIQRSNGLTLSPLLGIPLSCVGVFFLYQGLGNFFFFPNTTLIEYEKISSLPSLEREIISAEYLKRKAIESEEKQQDELINLFGLFPRSETKERKEYREYLEDISKK